MDELSVDEIVVSQFLYIVVHKNLWVIVFEPVLAVVCSLLVKTKINCITVLLIIMIEGYPVILYCLEILLSLLACRCTKTLVVLDPKGLYVGLILGPFFILRYRKERMPLLSSRGLDDGSYELLQEAFVLLKQVRPIARQEVDEQAFDVRAIMVLVSHQHYRTVTQ